MPDCAPSRCASASASDWRTSPRCVSDASHAALPATVNSDTQRLQPVLALDDAGVMIFAAADAQPVAADPFAATRDDRLARRQRAARRQRLGERVRRDDIRQAALTTRGRPFDLAQRDGPARRGLRGAVLLDERNAPAVETIQRARDIIQPVDADGFEIVPERRLDRALPARSTSSVCADARVAAQARGRPATP